MGQQNDETDDAALAASQCDTRPPESRVTTTAPEPSSRRVRVRELGRRTSTQKIRPWSQLPGVVAYLVLDGDEQITDSWGDVSSIDGQSRARAFRQRVRANRLDGSHTLEPCDETRRLLSIARRDGWFVHVWLEPKTDVAGILAILSG